MNRKSLNKSNILVVGGAGFVGSHIVDKLVNISNRIVVIDNMFNGYEDNLKEVFDNKKFVFYKDDAEDKDILEYILTTHKIDIVFNMATKALNYSFINPSNACNTNINVMSNLLELQRKKFFKTLVHSSSSEVYGSAIYEPMDEKHPINPTTTYAAGKAAADIILQSYVKMFNLDAFIIRPFNQFGPKQNYRNELMAIIPKTVINIIKGGTPEIHGGGQQSRDFIYVKDTANLFIKLYEIMEAGEIVNISADQQISMKDLIKKIMKILKYNGDISYKSQRNSDVLKHISSNKKLHSIINYNFMDFDEALEETISWYVKNVK